MPAMQRLPQSPTKVVSCTAPATEKVPGPISGYTPRKDLGRRLLMALYNLDLITSSHHVSTFHNQHQQSGAAAFHPINEYKDQLLKELLDLSNDFLFNNVTPFFPKSVSLKHSHVKSSAIPSTFSRAW
jgi:hypothetical protein